MLEHVGEVKSSDGCRIAFEIVGEGPTVMLVDGALCFRRLGPSQGMSAMLAAEGFRVVRFDRRGRGQSDSTPNWTVQQEIEDIASVVGQVGEEISLWGMSSGGLLALMAAAQLPVVRRVAIYEAPVLFDRSHTPMAQQWRRIASFIENGDRSGALNTFLGMVGMPAPARMAMRMLPLWRKLKVIAPTLLHDGDIGGPYLNGSEDSLRLLPEVRCDLLVSAGSRSPAWLVSNNKRLAGEYQQARYAMIDGDDHMVRPRQHRDTLTNFFGATA